MRAGGGGVEAADLAVCAPGGHGAVDVREQSLDRGAKADAIAARGQGHAPARPEGRAGERVDRRRGPQERGRGEGTPRGSGEGGEAAARQLGSRARMVQTPKSSLKMDCGSTPRRSSVARTAEIITGGPQR